MTGKIIRIDDYKRSFSNPKDIFRRVYFKVAKPDETIVWAKTDLVPSFRNYKVWRGLLKIGNYIGGLVFRNETTIDADSKVYLVKESEPRPEDDVELKKQLVFEFKNNK